MVTAAQVIIHFVGLCLFSNQVPNDCGQKVILPQVVYRDPTATMERLTAPGLHIGEPVAINRFGPQPHVEDHVALLVFKTASYITNVNWSAPTPLPGDPSYSYVKLDGDRIRIDTGLPEQPLNINDLKLPPLKTLCPTMGTLSAGFQPPYFGAAAVVDLPQGVVKSCMGGLRVDTEAKLDVSGTFVVQASTMRVRKELRLRATGAVELIVANVPLSCLSTTGCRTPDPSSIAGVSHVHAYYEMGTQSASCNASIQGWITSAPANDKPAGQCVVTVPAAAGGYGMEDAGKKMATNFECSNSKWP